MTINRTIKLIKEAQEKYDQSFTSLCETNKIIIDLPSLRLIDKPEESLKECTEWLKHIDEKVYIEG